MGSVSLKGQGSLGFGQAGYKDSSGVIGISPYSFPLCFLLEGSDLGRWQEAKSGSIEHFKTPELLFHIASRHLRIESPRIGSHTQT